MVAVRQVVQSASSGRTEVVDVPAPACGAGVVLVRTRHSVISAGTERAAVQATSGSVLEQARARPDLVHRLVDKVRRDGLASTASAVARRLAREEAVDTAIALGYSAAGRVIEVGSGVPDLAPGALVACAGAGHANHAEVIAVPQNLCAVLPEGTDTLDASFTTLGAIALQGVRVTSASVGEYVAVVGLGLIGLLTVQLLKVAGSRVVAMDLDAGRVELARALGAEWAVAGEDALRHTVSDVTAGRGADAVVLTAATRSSGPVALAGELCREKGRVVVVGDVGLQVPRTAYYNKELELRLSRSYGPGRYDRQYEIDGVDYPYAYVRWTEQRNMAAFLHLLHAGAVSVRPLVTHTFPIERAAEAYDLLIAGSNVVAGGVASTEESTSEEARRPIGIVLTYPESESSAQSLTRPVLVGRGVTSPSPKPTRTVPTVGAQLGGRCRLAVVGAGGFARAVLLPILKRLDGVELGVVLSRNGLTARQLARQFGFDAAGTDIDAVLGSSDFDAVIVATRHDQHAALATRALEAGKAVFVEKPLGLSAEELRVALSAQKRSGRPLMVGFNRRFAPLVEEAVTCVSGRTSPLTVNCRVNAGPLPADHWVYDPVQGGGRVVAEGCHFVDLAQFVVGSPPVEVSALGFSSPGVAEADNVVATLRFADASVCSFTYVSAGDRATGKERIEGFSAGAAFAIDDFRSGQYASAGRTWTKRTGWRASQDKGHEAELRAFVRAVSRNEPSPIDPLEAARASLVTFKIRESIVSGEAQRIEDGEISGSDG